MSFPAAGYIENNARTEGENKTAFADWLAMCKQIPGAGTAEQALTLATDTITPASGAAGIIAVDSEAAASTDNLATITQTNVPDGSLLILRIANAAHVITVKHLAGGTGQISLRSAADLVMNLTTQWLCVKRTGTLWEEVSRSGREYLTGPTLAGVNAAIVSPSITPGLNTNAYGLSVTPTLVEHSSGTHALMAGLYVLPVMTAGAGATTVFAGIAIPALTAQSGTVNAAGLYVEAPPTGATNNYALWVAGGNARLDGSVIFQGTGSAPAGSLRYLSPEGTSTDLYLNIPTSGIFAVRGNSAELMRLTDSGILCVGATVVAGAAAGQIVLANGSSYGAVNAAGTAISNLLSIDAADRWTIDAHSLELRIDNASTAASVTGGVQGYLKINIGAATRHIPYYNP